MRAWELYEQGNDAPPSEGRPRSGGTRKFIVSLHHINRLKRLKAAREAEHAQRQRLWLLMYAEPNTEQRSLDQREAELDAREEELRWRKIQADIEQAIANAEVGTQQRDHLRQLAMREVNRRMKNVSATSF